LTAPVYRRNSEKRWCGCFLVSQAGFLLAALVEFLLTNRLLIQVTAFKVPLRTALCEVFFPAACKLLKGMQCNLRIMKVKKDFLKLFMVVSLCIYLLFHKYQKVFFNSPEQTSPARVITLSKCAI
jgi:hypothetical protein